jgi:hypothetical protein
VPVFVPVQTRWIRDESGARVLQRKRYQDSKEGSPGMRDALAFDSWAQAYEFATDNVGGSIGGEIEIYRLATDADPATANLGASALVATLVGQQWTPGPAGRAGQGALAVDPA